MSDIPEMFGIDYNVGGEERPLAHTIKARYDAGVTNFKQDGTAVGIPISFSDGMIVKEINTAHCLSASGPAKEGMHTHQEMNRVVLPVLTPERAEKRQNGRRFKDNGEEAFTLTAQDVHGVAISVSGNVVSEGEDIARCLNANDQRKIFGANQDRTMVGECIEPKIRNGLQEHQKWQEGCSPTLTSAMGMGGGYTPIVEVPVENECLGVLRNVRSDFGKEIRKDYEAGNLQISRHEFLEHEVREDGITNTLDSVAKDNHVALKVKEATKQGYALAYEGDSINLSMPESQTRRGRVGRGGAQTLDTQCNQGVIVTKEAIPSDAHESLYVEIYPGCTVYAVWYEKYNCYIAIRKLTPRECYRLQGWDDEYFERAQFVNSDSQLYKTAGNGVTVNVVYEIAKKLS